MSEPYEIIMAPYEVWLAPLATAFPDLDEAPAAAWVKLGTSGKDNMDEEGVTVTHGQTLSAKRTLGSTGPLKVKRTEEELTISFTLIDLTLEQYAKALNGVTVTDVAAGAGTPGYRKITLRQGPDVTLYAMLCRGVSPYGDDYIAQYQVPKCYQSDSPAPVFNKGDAAALKLTFSALEDLDAATEAERFGILRSQDAAAV
jgi:hypothetical protein